MGTIKQLAEIAALVIFQEWSALKNNQRLDFFVLLYQDKRTLKIRSDFNRTVNLFNISKSFRRLLINYFFSSLLFLLLGDWSSSQNTHT